MPEQGAESSAALVSAAFVHNTPTESRRHLGVTLGASNRSANCEEVKRCMCVLCVSVAILAQAVSFSGRRFGGAGEG